MISRMWIKYFPIWKSLERWSRWRSKSAHFHAGWNDFCKYDNSRSDIYSRKYYLVITWITYFKVSSKCLHKIKCIHIYWNVFEMLFAISGDETIFQCSQNASYLFLMSPKCGTNIHKLLSGTCKKVCSKRKCNLAMITHRKFSKLEYLIWRVNSV